MKVSIIVPVFNAEKYLRECIESVIAQTLGDYELILVNDGSTDNSASICDKYSSLDSRIQVFHKPNDGPASAKNFGMERAQGEYIIFSMPMISGQIKIVWTRWSISPTAPRRTSSRANSRSSVPTAGKSGKSVTERYLTRRYSPENCSSGNVWTESSPASSFLSGGSQCQDLLLTRVSRSMRMPSWLPVISERR